MGDLLRPRWGNIFTLVTGVLGESEGMCVCAGHGGRVKFSKSPSSGVYAYDQWLYVESLHTLPQALS